MNPNGGGSGSTGLTALTYRTEQKIIKCSTFQITTNTRITATVC